MISVISFFALIGLHSPLVAQTPRQPDRPIGRTTPINRDSAAADNSRIAAATPVTPLSFSATKIAKINEHADSIFDLAATPDGKHMLSVGTDGKVVLYDTGDWRKLAEADDPERKSLGVRVSPDGNYAFTASDPSVTLVYKLPELKLLHRVKVDMARTTNVSCSSRLSMLAVAGAGPFTLVSHLQGRVMRDVPAFKSRSRVVWSQVGKTLYVVGDTKEGEAYELHRWTFPDGKTERICATPGEAYEMKWGQNASELCVTGAEHALVVNVDTDNVIDQWKSPDEHIVNDFLYWPRHDVYLTGTKGGNVYFWKHGDEKPISTFQATTSQVHQIVPLGDDRLATALQQSKNSLAIFKLTWTMPDVASVDPIKPIDPTTPTKAATPIDPLMTPTGPPANNGSSDPDVSEIAREHQLAPIHSFMVDTPFSRTVAFNANNTVLGVGLSTAGMAFIDPTTGEESMPRLHSGDAGQFVSLVQPHFNSGMFVVHESNSYIANYDLKKKERARIKGFGGLTGAVAWTPDRKLFFVGTKLDALDLADDTVVWFMSDHGGMKRTSDNRPLRGHKGSSYEGGLRVPLIVKWPGKTPANTVLKAPVTSLDIGATSLAMAGGDPKTSGLHGKDIRGYISGQSQDAPHQVLYWHTGGYKSPSGAMREGDYKLLYSGQEAELYNLKNDLSETTNLAATEPERVKSMVARWKEWASAAQPELWNGRGKLLQYADYEWLKGSPHSRSRVP